MRKKYLYVIIIVLLLCCFGVISLPIFNQNCEKKENRIYLRLGFTSIPITVNTCEVLNE